jgi:hypothetical protein
VIGGESGVSQSKRRKREVWGGGWGLAVLAPVSRADP